MQATQHVHRHQSEYDLHFIGLILGVVEVVLAKLLAYYLAIAESERAETKRPFVSDRPLNDLFQPRSIVQRVSDMLKVSAPKDRPNVIEENRL
jgi:hypothetical protein